MIAFELLDLRRANPPRGVALPPPEGGIDLLRERLAMAPASMGLKHPGLVEKVKAALAEGRAPEDTEVAAAAVAMLKADVDRPFGEDDDEERAVDDVNETLLGWFGSPALALRALARSTPLPYAQPGAPLYDESDEAAWLALARVLGRANASAYASARDVGREMRDKSKSVALRHAIATAFPSETWATDDARGYLGKKKSEAELRWYIKAAMLLRANSDVEVARQLMRDMLADKFGHPRSRMAGPALALAYRFGAAIQGELIAAFEVNLNARGLYGRHDREANRIASALAYLGTPEVGAVLAKRAGKSEGGDAAAHFKKRFPNVGVPSSKAPKQDGSAPGRVAVAGDFEIAGQTPEVWRAQLLEAGGRTKWGELAAPRARRHVGEVLDEWAKWITVETKAHVGRAKTDRGGSVRLRGVVDLGTYRAHAAELIASFRIGPPAVAKNRFDITGVLLWCVLGANRGIRFQSDEDGESSLEHLDDSVQDDGSIREAIASASGAKPSRAAVPSKGRRKAR